MASASKTTPASSGDDRHLVQVDDQYIALSFEDRLELLWQRYSRPITIAVTLIILAFVGRGVVGWMQVRQQAKLQAEFATLEGKDALLAFANAHPGKVLAGVARLRVADDFYSAGEYARAGTAYRDAATSLGKTALAGRALLGAALSVIQAGKAEEGETVLRQLADDVAQPHVLRAEAAYHLAVLAREAAKPEEAIRRLDQVASLGDTGLWGQRSVSLRAQLDSAKKAEPSASTPAPAAP